MAKLKTNCDSRRSGSRDDGDVYMRFSNVFESRAVGPTQGGKRRTESNTAVGSNTGGEADLVKNGVAVILILGL